MILKCKKIETSPFFETEHKYSLELVEFLDKLKVGEEFSMKVLSKKDARSIRQNAYYYGEVLPACQYYLDELNYCADPYTDKDTAHFQLKLNYCFGVRNDLLKVRSFKDPKTLKIQEMVEPFSWKMSNMPHTEACEFIEWCMKMVRLRTGKDFDIALAEMNIKKFFYKKEVN